MNEKNCPICHTSIPEHAPGGFCPACVLRGADEAAPDLPNGPMLEEIATAFPKLEILRLIGHGGMGYVYQARQPDLDRMVALKILSPALRRDPAFEERFAREARVLGKLKHPNIVTLYEHGESGGYFYLMMEFVDGVNLRQAMSAGRFTPEQALAIVPAICDALQSAHAQGVWHRDIKPENILLDKDGRVKIADFGIARILGDPERNFTLTRTGGLLGSAAYMAPEQHEKPHSVDHRADIYSLGVVIYEMLTGELPLGRFPAPSQRAAVNARIDEIVLRTLEKERELRQQSATEVKTEVESVAVPQDPRHSAGKAPADRRAPKALRGSLGCLFVGALLWVAAYSLAEPIRLATDSKDWFPKVYAEDSTMLGTLGMIAMLLKLSAIFGGMGLLGCLWVWWQGRSSGASRRSGLMLRQQSASEVRTEVEAVGGAATGDGSSGGVRPSGRTFPATAWALGLWMGGLAAITAGLFTSPWLMGLGCVAAFLGWAESGYVLYQIRQGRHPRFHRRPLMILVYWPTVAVLAYGAVLTWFFLNENRSHATGGVAGVGLLSYAAVSIAAPLLVAGLFWNFLGADPIIPPSRPGNAVRITLASILAVASVMLVQFVRTRQAQYRSYHSMAIQLHGEIREPEDLTLVRGALERALGDNLPYMRSGVHGANDRSRPPILQHYETPSVSLECVAADRSAADMRFRTIASRLRACLPKRIETNPGPVSFGSGDDRFTPPEVHDAYRSVRALNILLLAAPVIVVLLAGTTGGVLSGVPSMCALLVASAFLRSSWPAIPEGFPPTLDPSTPLPHLPVPEYDFSTTRDAIESLVKAAQRKDVGAFKRGISENLLEKALKEDATLAEPMRDWEKMSYRDRISQDGDHAEVRLKNLRTNTVLRMPLIREDGEWNVADPAEETRAEAPPENAAVSSARIEIRFSHPDVLSGGTSFKLPLVDSKGWTPSSGQPISLKNGKQVRVRARLADVQPSSAEVQVACLSDAGNWEALTKRVSGEDSVHTMRFANGTEAAVRFLQNSREVEPVDSPSAAMEEILNASKEETEKNKKVIQARCSKSLLAIAGDDGHLDESFSQLSRYRILSAKNLDEKTADVTVESDDKSMLKSTFRMVMEDGIWKLTEKVVQHR